MKVELKVSLTARELFDFMMKHTYSAFSGFLGVLLSVCALIGFFSSLTNENINFSYKAVLLITGLLFTVVQPLTLYLKSKKQVRKSEAVNKPLIYCFDDSLIKVSQGEECVEYEWSQLYKVDSTRTSVFVYMGRYSAFILPRSVLGGEELENLKALVKKNAVMAKSVRFGK